MGEAVSTSIAQQLALVAPAKAGAQTLTLPVLLAELPPVLSEVTRPLSINGTLIGMLTSQDMLLRTSMGPIKLALAAMDHERFTNLLQTLGDTSATPLPLATLHLDKGGASAKGLLTLPLPEKPPLTPAAPQPSLASTAAPQATATQPFPLGKPLPALVLAPLQDSATSPSPIVTPSQSTATPPPLSQQPQPAHATAGAAPTQTQGPQSQSTPATAPPMLPDQQAVTIHTVHTPSGKWLAQNTVSSTAPKLEAVVTGHMPSGNPVLTAGKTTIIMQEPLSLPVGTKLVVSLTPRQETTLSPLPTLSTDTLADLAQSYVTALPEIVASAGARQPAASMPTASTHLAGTLLFFLSALHSGKMDEWLPAPRLAAFGRNEKGDKPSAKTALIDALTAPELVQASDTKVGSWHCYAVPLQADGFCHTLRLYVHQDDTPHDEARPSRSAAKKTRFVVTLTLSKLGDLQLDGLSRPQMLDLVLRSEKPLPLALVNELRATTLHSFEAIGLKGSIHFQSGEANWINFHHQQSSFGVEV